MYPDPAAIKALADALEGAGRPLILAGRGAVVSGAEQALADLAERTGALVATSVCGHGLFANDPWCLGISGGFGSPAADALIAESDLIIGFGVSFTPWTAKRGKLIAAAASLPRLISRRRSLGGRQPSHTPCSAMPASRPRPCWLSCKRRGAAPRGWRDVVTGQRLRDGANHTTPTRTFRPAMSSIPEP